METDKYLTKRESDIVRGYVLGLIGKEIAERLNISYRTVVVHTQNIYEKTGIGRSTNALVSWWYQTNFSIDIKQILTLFFLSISLISFCDKVSNRRSQSRVTQVTAVRPPKRTIGGQYQPSFKLA